MIITVHTNLPLWQIEDTLSSLYPKAKVSVYINPSEGDNVSSLMVRVMNDGERQFDEEKRVMICITSIL
jgi:uncharacterized iron-regulated membrane protein